MKNKQYVTLTSLALCLVMTGCSSEMGKKQPLYNPNFISTLLHEDVMAKEPARHAKCIMEPAVNLSNAFTKEISILGNLENADQTKIDEAVAIASKYLPKAKQIQKDMLDAGDAIIPHVRYMIQINNYVNNFVMALEKYSSLDKLKAKNRTLVLKKIAGHKYWQDISLLGYNHYKLILTKGDAEYQLSVQLVNKLHKGMTYKQVVEVLQFPGENIRHGEYVWLHKDAYLFAAFENGKLEFWKLNGAY